MKWIALIALIFTGNAYAEVWTCEMQPRVLGEPRHGETVTHTFTIEHDEETGYEFADEHFTTDLEYTVEWMVLRETEFLLELMPLRPALDEVERAVLFKKAKRAVKTLVMGDMSIILSDQGSCEITGPAREG